jgi:quercetin dioxygenase-like cupin family protein
MPIGDHYPSHPCSCCCHRCHPEYYRASDVSPVPTVPAGPQPNAPISFSRPTEVDKVWGKELHVVNLPEYCGKILVFAKNAAFSLHWHHEKTETWYVLSGSLRLTYLDLAVGTQHARVVEKGDVIHVPAGNPHRLEALEDSEVMEVSTTDRSWDNYRLSPSWAAKT